MLKREPKQLSLYSILYNKIPENHILKLINNAVDFSFINKLLENSYCKYYGRPAKEPEMMAKLSIIQHLYNLSDENVIADATVNLAYMWFIGINPEEDLPDPSLLAKFRTKRLKDITLDEIIIEVVKQCVEKGIIKGNKVSIDTTHIEANTIKKVPERIMKHLARKIIKCAEEIDEKLAGKLNKDIPEYKEIEDVNEAKQVMKNYLEELIETVENENIDHKSNDNVKLKNSIKEAKDILESPKFIEQKGIRSLVDKDARVGRKTKTSNFFGYKTEYAMMAEEKIITSVTVNNGAYVDGENFDNHLRNTMSTGAKIKEVYGDKAYFRKNILKTLEAEEIEPYIPVSASAYKMDESDYNYNKDSDQWICKEGNYSIRKKYFKRKDGRKFFKYYFDKNDCQRCPHREKCYKGKSKAKNLVVGADFQIYEKYAQKQKTTEFLEKYKSRASIENKNAEMKRFHGLFRAKGYGLKSMQTQAKLTALAVNLKRIVRIISSLNTIKFNFKITSYQMLDIICLVV